MTLEILKKIFLEISADSKKKLLCGPLQKLLRKLRHPEVLLKLIDILEMSIFFLKSQFPSDGPSSELLQQPLAEEILLQVLLLLKQICDKIDLRFLKNDKVSVRLFEVLMTVRETITPKDMAQLFSSR